MIGFLRGELLERAPTRVVIDVNGVGYEVHIPVSTFGSLPPAGRAASLQIYTHVREDAIQLYGFATAREKALFEKLLSVSGIGPKLALAILSGIAADQLAVAIRGSDVARLTAIPGVGKKTAERVVLELRDKIEPPAAAAVAAGTPASTPAAEDVLSALLNLGYPRPVAEKALARAVAAGKQAGFDQLFTECMRLIP